MHDPIPDPAPSSAETPYLSVVATSRNDNHGGGLQLRMQLFLDGLAHQCRRFRLPTELILVDWNPPADKPKLSHVLTWPEGNPYLTCRVIEVPHDLHMRLEHAARLPLYQMIAKNVGIRRARGRFVLATNIDILFPDSLIERMARQDLESNTMYRVDRHDTDAPLAVEMPFEDQIAACQAHVLRIFRPDRWEFPRETEAAAALPTAQRSKGSRIAATGRQVLARLESLARLSARPGRNAKELHRHWALLQADLGNPAPYEQWQDAYPRMPVHTAGCGDFTMLTRDDWIKLTGYAEFEMYSFHIDSLFCLCAHAAGVTEVSWPDPMYHLEHEGGWAPEPDKETRLLSSLQKRTVPLLSFDDLIAYHLQMRETRAPLFFNRASWGLADETLPETVFSAHGSLQR